MMSHIIALVYLDLRDICASQLKRKFSHLEAVILVFPQVLRTYIDLDDSSIYTELVSDADSDSATNYSDNRINMSSS